MCNVWVPAGMGTAGRQHGTKDLPLARGHLSSPALGSPCPSWKPLLVSWWVSFKLFQTAKRKNKPRNCKYIHIYIYGMTTRGVVHMCNDRTAGGTRAGDDTWVEQSRAGGGSWGWGGCGSFTWGSHSFSCLGAKAGDALPAPDGMELLHSAATQPKSPQACPCYYESDQCFPLP